MYIILINPYGSEWVMAYDDDDYYYYYDYDGEKLVWSISGSDCPQDLDVNGFPMTWYYNSVSTGGQADAQLTVTAEDWSCPSGILSQFHVSNSSNLIFI